MSEIETIKGGWGNVPKNLYCKTDLNEMGLRPTGKPVAEVWNHYNWISLYDIKDTKIKRKPTEKQLAALKKGREKRIENLSCSRCGTFQGSSKNLYGELCRWCLQQVKIEEMEKEGEELFKSWHDKDFVILDTATTGLENDSEIVEITIIDKNGKILFDSLIKPKGEISSESVNFHDITSEKVSDYPTWKEVYDQIKTILEDKEVLMYNADFDNNMIENSCENWGMENIQYESQCVMESYALYCGSERWINLNEASERYNQRNSLDNCLSILKIIEDVWKEVGLE